MAMSLLLAFTIFCFGVVRSEHNHTALWSKFKLDYNKTYLTPNEEAYRFGVFLSNYKKATQMDLEASIRYNATYGDMRVRYGINSLSDMTPEEFRNGLLMTDLPPPPAGPFLTIPPEPKDGIPDSWDWRQKGVVTGVYNQGTCGSCWAFSATECVESATALGGHGLHNLSPQQIVDCDDEAQHGCRGGWPMSGFVYIHGFGGQDALSCYPYTGTDGSCHANAGCRQGTVNQYGYLGSNEYDIAVWMVAHGPVSICVDASNWQYYNGGIVGPSACGHAMDHCVQMVGYVTSRPSYWIVRNSWGTGWGPYGGYILLEEGTNTCDLAQYASGAIY